MCCLRHKGGEGGVLQCTTALLHCNVMLQVGLHYGAVTCYSCRAFFRRAQDRKRKMICKQSGACNIEQSRQSSSLDVSKPSLVCREGKHCPKCRLDKCLAVGMLPDLVLNTEEKIDRFKLMRKNERFEQVSHTDLSAYQNSENLISASLEVRFAKITLCLSRLTVI